MFYNNVFNNYSPFNNTYNYNYPYRRQEPIIQKPNDTISIIIHRILNDSNNYTCFDCHKQINCLKYFDIKNGVFLCNNCAIQHSRYPKEVTEVMSGDIRSLEEHILCLLYYGGNKNLANFMKIYFPLLEKMEKKNMYSTIAMDYYRKLLKSKINNEREPYMPRKLEGYNSIFRNGYNPANENENPNNYRDSLNHINRNKQRNNGLFNSDFNRNAGNNNDKDEDGDGDVEMKDEDNCSKKRNDIANEDAGKTRDKLNKNKNKKNVISNEKDNDVNILTINQMGELSMYPDAFEIDRMEC